MSAKKSTTDNSDITPEQFYAGTNFVRHKIFDAAPAVRVFGSGPAIVFIHGFPTHGYTWRKLLPSLSKDFTCYVIDLPGLGDSDWSHETNFSFTAQASRLSKLFEMLELNSYVLIAHNTGGTIARLVALANSAQVRQIIVFNTEIPHHRPPWISAYQVLARIPGANAAFRLTMRLKLWQVSSLGFKEFYTDKALLEDPTNLDPYLDPVINSSKRMHGLLGYLKGIEWPAIDKLASTHKLIKAPTLFLWGKHDKTFPIELALGMMEQFDGQATLTPVSASLLPHEEKPLEVLKHISSFISRSYEARPKHL